MAEFGSAQLRQWAVKGAEQRLQEIAAEAAAIHQAFPELRDRGHRAATAATAAKGRRRRRSNMTAAQRKAVSDRMTKYWAARRENAGDATSAGGAKGKAARPAKAARAAKAAAAGKRGARKMSAAARKRISDAQKKRWAARRANG